MIAKINKLFAGYTRFRQHYLKPSQTLFKTLVEQGQNPLALIIGCCDSRVDPAIVLDCDPGDLFVVRNVANLVPPHEDDQHYHGTSAALEFGVCTLNIPNIIIMGHSQCGGIRSLFENKPEQKGIFISKWMQLVKIPDPSQMKDLPLLTQPQKEELYGKESLINSLNNLKSFPWIQERLSKGSLNLHAWYFKLETGIIEHYDPQTHKFKPIDTPENSD